MNKFEKSKYISAVVAEKTGKVKEINAEEIGKLACYLGAGRVNKEDTMDPSVGISLNTKVGYEEVEGDFLA